MQKIVEAEGGNNFKLPHSGVRKQMKADGWSWVDLLGLFCGGMVGLSVRTGGWSRYFKIKRLEIIDF